MRTNRIKKLFTLWTLVTFSFLVLFSEYSFGQAETSLARAQDLLSQGKYDEAVKVLDGYIAEIQDKPEQKPDLAAANYLLAKVYFEVGDDEKCDAALLAVYTAHPGFDQTEPNFGFKERVTKVKAQLAGKVPVTTMAEKPQEKPASPEPARTYLLSIQTVPENVVIYVNGERLGRGPLKLDLVKPNCEVRVEMSGYISIQDSFTIPDNGISKNYELKPLAAPAATAIKPKTINPLVSASLPQNRVRTSSANSVNLSAKEIEKKLSQAKSTRTVGLLLTLIFGTGTLFFGLDAALSEEYFAYGWYDQSMDHGWKTKFLGWERTGSFIACGAAALFTLIGIFNWSRGQKHLKQMKKEKTDLQIGLDIRPNIKHYGISLAFIF